VVFAAAPARASKPIEKALVGCVLDGKFYSIDGRAYPISTSAALDLKPYEGKGVSITGWLSPGDRFDVDEGVKPVVRQAKCPDSSVRLVKREKVIRLRADADYAMNAGDFDKAVALVEQAVAMVAPADCDTYVDRAHVYTRKGDLETARKDVAVVKAGKCIIDKGKRMNPLLLQDLGNALRDKGDKPTAITVFQLGLGACDGDWCRGDLEKGLAAAQK
jgi:hypothetical protein